MSTLEVYVKNEDGEVGLRQAVRRMQMQKFRRQQLSDAEAVTLLTLALELVFMTQAQGKSCHNGHIRHGVGQDDYIEALMRMGAKELPRQGEANRRMIQIILLSGGFVPQGFEPDGNWGPLSNEAYTNVWVIGRELDDPGSTQHSHCEASAAGCSHPECLIRHIQT